jgi:hypothetical protein
VSNEIIQHIPACVDVGPDRIHRSFNTLDELKAVPFVNGFTRYENFHQFSVSGGNLIAEYRGGREWWVVGRLAGPVDGLSEWDHGIYEVYDADGEATEIAGRDVVVSCGDQVGLRNGQTLKRRRVETRAS